MLNNLFDILARRAEIFARIESCRMRRHVFADTCGQAEAQVGVDVDFADRRFRSAAELILRNADGVVQSAAVVVDDLDEFRHDGGSAVQYDREVRQTLLDFRENVETQLGRYEYAFRVARALGRLEFESAVARADGDGEGVDAGFFDELLYFLGARIGSVFSFDVDVVLDAGQFAEFAFHDDAF